MITAPYLRWAKVRPRVTYDLAASGLQHVTTRELLGDIAATDAFDLGGPNDEGYMPLREAIAARYGMTPASVAIANGAAGANFLACMALLEPGDEALIERPAYDPLMAAVQAAGASVVHFDRSWAKGFALDPYMVRTALTPRTKLIVISNAHNPSGALASREALEQVGIMAEAIGARVLVDEVYAEAQHDDTPPPLAAAQLGPVFVSTNSLTKAYGLAGLRCGWVLASPALSQRIRETRDIVDGSGAFPPEQLAVKALAKLDELRARARIILSRNLAIVEGVLASHPRIEWLRPMAGTTAFPRIKGMDDTTALVDRLIADYDTVAVPGHFFQAPQHIRISFGGKTDMLVEALSRLDRALGS